MAEMNVKSCSTIVLYCMDNGGWWCGAQRNPPKSGIIHGHLIALKPKHVFRTTWIAINEFLKFSTLSLSHCLPDAFTQA